MSDHTRLDPDQPYPSQRAAVHARNMVSSSQPLATQAGLQALAAGGNAVDAALSAAITLTVVEPTGNGIGSDAFAQIWDGQTLFGLNGSGRAPAAWTPDYFKAHKTMPKYGWDAVTVPGAVDVWVQLSKRFGRLPFEALFDAAIRYGDEGFQVGPRTAWLWQDLAERYAVYPDFVDHFLPAPQVGQRVLRPDAARTLRAIAASGGETFYRGELATLIEQSAIAGGGALRAPDLAAHRSDWVTPLQQRYRDVILHEIPPNGQGLAALLALGMLAFFEPPPLDSVDSVHLQIEVMKIALKAAADHLGDADAMRVSPDQLLAVDSLARAAATISERAAPSPAIVLPMGGDTVYLSTADQDGMMVSFIQSNFHHFGAGIVIPGTGIAMQNRGFGFSLERGHANEVGPGKRPFHTIIPGFVTRDGQAWASFGVMGGPMQAQGHVQMISRMVDHEQNPQAASDAPRWQVLADGEVALERGFPGDVADGLAARGHRLRREITERAFGGAQLIVKTPHGYIAGSDHRKEGQASGF